MNNTRKVPANIQAKTSQMILQIQAQARANIRARGIACPDLDRCTTCGRPAAAPYRRIVDGRIVEGCVDAHHQTGYLQGASLAWHMQPSAHVTRKAVLVHFKTL